MKNDGHWSECYHCKSTMWMPHELYVAAYAAKEKITFYCAYGHPQVFCTGESRLDAMRRERDQAIQRVAQREDHIRQLNNDLAHVTKQREELRRETRKVRARISHGVCPCCNRQFVNMAKHMKSKHPNYEAEKVA